MEMTFDRWVTPLEGSEMSAIGISESSDPLGMSAIEIWETSDPSEMSAIGISESSDPSEMSTIGISESFGVYFLIPFMLRAILLRS